MANGKTYKEQIIYLRAENKAQTKEIKDVKSKLNYVIKELDDHKNDSEDFRIQQGKNTENIKTIREESFPTMIKLVFGLYGILGTILLSVLGIFVKHIFFK